MSPRGKCIDCAAGPSIRGLGHVHQFGALELNFISILKDAMAPKVHQVDDIEAKPNDNFVEMSVDGEKDGVLRNGDYSGAVEKTSAEEIRLVRKLDMRIMPTLWAMYFLNYVSVFLV